ncbi:MFS monocarboxylate transporter [Aspergillus niger]|uniref:MFS monocarboxylate transporter n=1 Tax=Aspergillus niger TaxID=5061 RepID=A0A100I1Z1_ASPNG|nr:MFS monocarboxylate transporter [Aspergillus niger]
MAHPNDAPSTKPPSEYTPIAIMTLIGSFCGMFCTVGFVNSFGLFLEYYKKDQLSNQPESTIAWIASIDIFFIFGVSVVSGPLLDTLGPRLLLCIGSLGTIFSIMMTSLCKQLYQFILAQGILLGISLSLLTCPMIALVGQHIKIKRGAAVGIVIGGSSLGGVLWPIIVNELLKKPNIGFGWTMRIVGFIMLPLLTVTCFCCRPAAPPPPSPSQQPQAHPEPESEKPTPSPSPKVLDTPLLKNPTLHLTCLSFFIIYFGMFSPFFYVSSYGVAKGFSSSLSFYTISMLNGASLFGRIIGGILADKYGRFNVCIVFTILSGVVCLCWTKATSVAGLVVFAVAYGFASGAILSLQQACALQLATPKTVGLAVGVVMGATALSAMAGIPISGALVQKYGFLALSIYAGEEVYSPSASD